MFTMQSKLAAVLIAAASALVPATVRACEYDPFLFQLPGETLADAEQRSGGIRADHQIVSRYNRERAAFDNAKNVYLGRITALGPRGSADRDLVDPSATVRVIAALRGEPPKERKLTGQAAGGLCWDRGDGLGAFAKVGDLVVVFEGLPVSEDRPRGIDSLPAKAIRTVPLLDELRKHGKDLE
jgi:hypothetical protein